MSAKLKVRECTQCGAEMCLESLDTEFYLCPECGTYFDDEYFDSMEAAIAYWNKRPYIDSLIARAEKAKAERDEARTMAERLAEAGNAVIHQAFAEEGNISYDNARNLINLIAEWKEMQK